ncbi:Uncharacterised protein [Streptococcus pneumoniae]|nr:Uncharacterised protein [Streptococcus pneumoniae]
MRRVSSPTPSCGATARIECERGPPSATWRSRTIRTARSRSSGVYFLGMFRFSFSWIGTKPRALQSGLFEVLHHRAWERAGHTGGFDDRSPVVLDRRRAVAPNTPQEDLPRDPRGASSSSGERLSPSPPPSAARAAPWSGAARRGCSGG